MTKIQLPRISQTKRVYIKSNKPADDDRFPMTQRYFHKAFAEQGVLADGLSLEQIEQACWDYSLGDRRKRQDTDIYEDNQFFEDFVHDDDLHQQNRADEREYANDFNDGDCRWSFSYVRTEYGN